MHTFGYYIALTLAMYRLHFNHFKTYFHRTVIFKSWSVPSIFGLCIVFKCLTYKLLWCYKFPWEQFCDTFYFVGNLFFFDFAGHLNHKLKCEQVKVQVLCTHLAGTEGLLWTSKWHVFHNIYVISIKHSRALCVNTYMNNFEKNNTLNKQARKMEIVKVRRQKKERRYCDNFFEFKTL